jgi:hypothetical protein
MKERPRTEYYNLMSMSPVYCTNRTRYAPGLTGHCAGDPLPKLLRRKEREISGADAAKVVVSELCWQDVHFIPAK